MTEETTDPATETPAQEAPKGFKKHLKSVIFLVIVAGVVATFTILSRLDHPPDLPSDPIHKFRFDTSGNLVGLAVEDPGGPLIVEHSELKLDLKAIEARVNNVCAGCHGAPGLDLTSHPCVQGGKCIPEQHPPKNTCIKCHRHSGR